MLKVVVVNLRGDESLALMDILIWLKVLLQVQQFEVLIATLIFKKRKNTNQNVCGLQCNVIKHHNMLCKLIQFHRAVRLSLLIFVHFKNEV
ncbi:MAG: hypothetical protein ACJAWQ_002580 [Paraglaciecola sp.]